MLKNMTALIFFMALNFGCVFRFTQLAQNGANPWIARIFLLLTGISFVVYYLQVQKYTLKLLLFILIAIGYAVISYGFTHNWASLLVLMMILVTKELSVKTVLKYNTIALGIAFSLVVLSSFVGITDMGHFEGIKSTGEEFAAYTLGFAHWNTPPAIIFAILAGYNLFHNDVSFKKKEIIAEIFIAIVVMQTFGSRTFGITMIGYILLMTFIPRLGRIRNFRYFMWPMQYLFTIASVVTLYIALFYDNMSSGWYDLNLLMSTRPYLWHMFMNYYEMNFFGHDMTAVGETTSAMALDNGYLYLLVYLGLGMLLIYNIIFAYVSKLAYKHKQWGVLVTIIAYEIYALSESTVLLENYCAILLIFGVFIMNKQNLKPDEF